MPQMVVLILMLLFVVGPSYAALRRCRWSVGEVRGLMVAVPLLLFALNAPLHEASHILGTYLMGGTVGRVKLLQPFWQRDAPVPMIESSGLGTATGQLVAAVLPYAVDAGLLAIGAALVNWRRIKSPWGFGASLVVFVLKPSFDIAANVAAASIYGVGDFRQVAAIIGWRSAAVLQGTLLIAGIAVTLLAVVRASCVPNGAPTADVS